MSLLLLFQSGEAAAASILITAEAGSLVLTGTAAGLKAGRKVAALSGSFAETGQSASFIADRLLTAASEAFAVDGSDAGLSKGRTLPAEAGEVLVTHGYAYLGSARLMLALGETYQADGADTGLLVGRTLLAEAGEYEVDAYEEHYLGVTGGSVGVAGGKGDDADEAAPKTIFKPTGLPPYRTTVEQRVQETREIHQEVARERKTVPKPVKKMSLHEIEAEIGERLREQLRKEDEEIVLMLLAAAG